MSADPNKSLLELAQDCVSRTPVIILGSGASAAYGIPGMPQLRDHLMKIACPRTATPDEVAKWVEFQAKLATTDLETALNEVRLPESLTALVVESTWDYLAPFDHKVFEKAIVDHNLFPLTKLFLHLFNSTRTDIHVVTPNYDRIAEYAADAGKLIHYTGFNYGHIRSRAITGKPRIHVGTSASRTVNVWKVHGSFDWFRDSDGIVFGLPISNARPRNVVPVIVTPGIEKYRLTHDEPFHSIKSEADKALQTADAYLCIGYGFNDTHLQTTLVERCREKDVPLVLLTKTISATAKAFLKSGKCGKYLAVEEAPSGCRIFSKEFPAGEEIAGSPTWQLGEFLKLVIS
ncbi:MAG: SIR2 family protein [Verrucomicrobiales bacterium]|nr:SIR2 family protein [Verrucomicrobiales bacterium]